MCYLTFGLMAITNQPSEIWHRDGSQTWLPETYLSCVILTVQVPDVENVDIYKNVSVRQHVTSIDILSELHSQEMFGGNFSCV
jgi:hypothetical protein